VTTVTDDFNRANASPIAGDWETLGPAGVRLNTNRVDASAGSAQCLSGYKATTYAFAADQSSQITNTVVAAFGDFVGVGVRCTNAGGGRGYVTFWNGGNGRVYLYKVSAGALGTAVNSVVNTWTANDIIKLAAVTNGANCDLTVYKNGSSIMTYSDTSTPYTDGQPAIYAFNGNANGTKGDDWVGEDAAASGIAAISSNYRRAGFR
jgi:hypothetical protein